MTPQPDEKPVVPNTATDDSLVVREHERRQCRLSAVASVSADSDTRVSLSRTVGDGTGSFPCRIVDFSAGGLGIESSVFLPRGALVDIRLAEPAGQEPVRLCGAVKRATMTSRAPTYYLGIAFRASDLGDILIQRLAQLAGSGVGEAPRSAEVNDARP